VAQENAFFENMASKRLPDAEGRPRLFFMDGADRVGLGQISLAMVGWATGFADFDNDGDQDLFEVMGGAYAGDGFYDVFYENPGFGRHWVAVRLVGIRTNRSAIGARPPPPRPARARATMSAPRSVAIGPGPSATPIRTAA